MEILHIENLSFTYPKTCGKTLDKVSVSIEEGSFNVICGKTGCGKTTLLRLIKKEIAPAGETEGDILFRGTDINELSERDSACRIGFVMQNPDTQIVTDKVWRELAFGLENAGLGNKEMKLRVAETAEFFGLQNHLDKKTYELSGGLKQILNLAAVTAMRPELIIFDEPTGQLDPVAAAEFISMIKKMNTELGLTVIIAEHRLEDILPVADKIFLMEDGKIILSDSPRAFCKRIKNTPEKQNILPGLPSAVRIFDAFGIEDECPLSVKEGKRFITKHFNNKTVKEFPHKKYIRGTEKAVEMKDIYFRYEKNAPDILRGACISIYRGEFFCLLGGNGTGKSTTLRIIADILKPYAGAVYINGKRTKTYKNGELYKNNIAFLPQDPSCVFIKSSVEEDFAEITDMQNIPGNEKQQLTHTVSEKLGISALLQKHPYDLSGGEQQLCALAKILLTQPRILILDEPTKGLDACSIQNLCSALKILKNEGLTIITATHDVNFAAENADRCALFFNGEITDADVPDRFFESNCFYTTAASRISRHIYKGCVTCDQVVRLCRENEVIE